MSLLTVRDKLVNPSVALGEIIEQLQATVKARLAGIFRAEHPPLWSPRIRESLHKEWQTVGPQIVLERFEENGQVSLEPTQTLGFQLVLFVALGLSLRWLRDRTRVRAQDDARVRSAQLVFEHPWAMAVLITAVLTVPLDPLAPRSVGLIAAVFIAVATLRIVQRYLPPAMILFAWGLAVLLHSRSMSRPAGHDAHARTLRLPRGDARRARPTDMVAATKSDCQTA